MILYDILFRGVKSMISHYAGRLSRMKDSIRGENI